jgi:hypothetical protein
LWSGHEEEQNREISEELIAVIQVSNLSLGAWWEKSD